MVGRVRQETVGAVNASYQSIKKISYVMLLMKTTENNQSYIQVNNAKYKKIVTPANILRS